LESPVNAVYKETDLAKRQGVDAKSAVMAAPVGPEQKRTLALLAEYPDALERSCRPGHLTGSALVIDPVDHRVLMLFHSKLRRWLQPGGHADGDPDLARVALREAVEETGINDLRLVEPAIDLDVHWVDPPGESPHEHHDVRFLVVAPSEAKPVGNHESKALRWICPSKLVNVNADTGLCRLVDRGLALVSRLQNDGVI
jgi:8-oxo-dGTP pyrophosphatase MutT (NUDIX family)